MLAVVRIGGTVDLRRGVRDTLMMLKLDAPMNCVLVPAAPEYKGMLEKVKNHVTYGEVDKQTLVEVLRKRLRTPGNERVDASKTHGALSKFHPARPRRVLSRTVGAPDRPD